VSTHDVEERAFSAQQSDRKINTRGKRLRIDKARRPQLPSAGENSRSRPQLPSAGENSRSRPQLPSAGENSRSRRPAEGLRSDAEVSLFLLDR